MGRVQLLMYVCAIMRLIPVHEIQNLEQIQSFGCVSLRKIGGERANYYSSCFTLIFEARRAAVEVFFVQQ